MSVPLFRTSLLRSTQALNGPLRNVSRTLGRVNGNVLVRVVLPYHSVLVPSRNFTTTFAVTAAAAKTASTKKASTTKGRAVTKKSPAKKVPAKTKVATKKKKVVAKKKPVKAKKKKVEKPKAPRIYKKDWSPPFKKPLSPWTNFVVHFMKGRTSDKPIDLGSELLAASQEWKTMNDEQKAVYAPSAGDVEEYSRKLSEWNAALSKPLKKAKLKYMRSRRKYPPKPLQPYAQFIKEQFNQAKYPADVTTSILKLRYLAKLFVEEVTESDKAGLKERAEEEFRKKQAAGA